MLSEKDYIEDNFNIKTIQIFTVPLSSKDRPLKETDKSRKLDKNIEMETYCHMNQKQCTDRLSISHYYSILCNSNGYDIDSLIDLIKISKKALNSIRLAQK